MIKQSRARLTIDLDEEHTAILDSIVKGKEGRNGAAKRRLELALQTIAVEFGAAPIGPGRRPD